MSERQLTHGTSAGYNRRRCRCVECVEWARTYHRDRVRRIKAEWFADKQCVICGSTESLEIDHIDPSTKSPLLGKSGSNQDMWKWPKARREAELALCQVLCRSCHLDKCSAEMVERHAAGLHPKVDTALGRAARKAGRESAS